MADYLALPKSEGRHPAVVVIHEWWGVNEQIHAVADRWAAHGFLALAPDLFHGKVIPIGRSDEAGAAMKALDFGRAVQEIAAAIETVRSHSRGNGKVAITGYCMGGALTLATACNVRGLSAVVPFYGMPPGGDWAKIEAPVQAHFAQHDDWATVEGAKKIQAAITEHGGKMELHTYDAHHAFCNDRRPEVFNPAAAQQSWDRMVAFVTQHTR
jgi:carboxymethylenebutenolidase